FTRPEISRCRFTDDHDRRPGVNFLRSKSTSDDEWRAYCVEIVRRNSLDRYPGKLCWTSTSLVEQRDHRATNELAIEADALHTRQRCKARHELLLKDFSALRVVTAQLEAVANRKQVLHFEARIGHQHSLHAAYHQSRGNQQYKTDRNLRDD